MEWNMFNGTIINAQCHYLTEDVNAFTHLARYGNELSRLSMDR
jgi:hypothetical protein